MRTRRASDEYDIETRRERHRLRGLAQQPLGPVPSDRPTHTPRRHEREPGGSVIVPLTQVHREETSRPLPSTT